MAEKNPLVFMDVSVDKVYAGRMIFELFKGAAPAAAENFRALCTGEKGIGEKTGLPLHYKGSFFYGISGRRSYVKGGDLFSRIGTCGESIYGENFPNDINELKHDERGLLSVNICDRYGIGSHFVITLKPDSELDRFHVVFGKLRNGVDILDKIIMSPWGAPVQVIDCGECNEGETQVIDCGERNEGETSRNQCRMLVYSRKRHGCPTPNEDLI